MKSRSESNTVVRFSIKVSKVDQIAARRLYFSMLKLYVLPMATRSSVIVIDHINPFSLPISRSRDVFHFNNFLGGHNLILALKTREAVFFTTVKGKVLFLTNNKKHAFTGVLFVQVTSSEQWQDLARRKSFPVLWW